MHGTSAGGGKGGERCCLQRSNFRIGGKVERGSRDDGSDMGLGL